MEFDQSRLASLFIVLTVFTIVFMMEPERKKKDEEGKDCKGLLNMAPRYYVIMGLLVYLTSVSLVK